MADAKTGKKVKIKKSKTPKPTKPTSRTRASLQDRNEKRVKVESGIKGLSKSLHHVKIMSRQVREIYGYVAEETATTVVVKTRAYIGASRKPLFKHIPRTDIVAYEGKVGKACKVLVRAPQLLVEYKDVTVSYKGESLVMKTTDGDEITIVNMNMPGITIDIDGDAS